ncbi:MAG: hypothetical protein HKN68_15925 [Saprospiraceae bacterium]|nr:hypothetical protein [Saprospiraceae bacterium]
MDWSRISLCACIILIFCTGFLYYPKWKQSGTEATLSWDASGYYMYLPATFIYNDLRQCSFQDEILSSYGPTPDFQQAFKHSSGNYVMKYSIGQAVQFLPAFLLSHVYASFSSAFSADGFSRPYQLGISIHAFIIAVIGLFVLFKVLRLYFDDKTVALTLIAITFGSNYLDYAAINGAMTHNGLFTIYALLLFASHRYHKDPSFKWAAVIGLLVGLASLTRPTEIISILIPLLWGLKWDTIKGRFHFLLNNRLHLLAAGSIILVIGSIQLIYWKYSSGEWIVYSYEDQGFSWLRPHIWEGLFSYKSGWLTYSPMFILILPGIYALRQMHPQLLLMTLVFILLFIYIAFAWDIWWYGGSLGQRAMVQAYPVIAFPLAAGISFILQRKWITYLFFIFLFFSIIYNLWLTHHAHRGGLFHAGQMTQEYFWKILGKNEKKEEYLKLLDTDEEHAFTVDEATLIFKEDFEDEGLSSDCGNPISDEGSLCLNAERQFSAEFKIDIASHGGKWIHTSTVFHCINKEWNSWQMTQYIVKFYKNDQEIKSRLIRVHRLLHDGETQSIGFESQIPEDADTMGILYWNAGSNKTILLDDLKVLLIN